MMRTETLRCRHARGYSFSTSFANYCSNFVSVSHRLIIAKSRRLLKGSI
jgi:hypothetical protein